MLWEADKLILGSLFLFSTITMIALVVIMPYTILAGLPLVKRWIILIAASYAPFLGALIGIVLAHLTV